jgi:hypothetical protein
MEQHMIRKVLPVVLSATLLAACQPDEQTLPFETSSTASVSQTISSSGGLISTPAGASLLFPSGSLAASTTVTITPTAPSAIASALGTVLATNAMAITPVGAQLVVPGVFETQIQTTNPNAWLGAVLLEAGAIRKVYANASIDLNNGILHTNIDRLGTLTPFVAPAAARFPVTKFVASAAVHTSLDLPADLAANGAKTVSKNCGGFTAAGAYIPCAGITATATQNVIDKYGAVEGLFPMINGTLTFASDPTVAPAVVTGGIDASTNYRVAASAPGGSASTLDLFITVAPTAATRATQVGSTLTLTNVNTTMSWTGHSPTTTLGSVVLTVSGNTASLDETRTVDLGDDANGVPQTGTVRLRLVLDITIF